MHGRIGYFSPPRFFNCLWSASCGGLSLCIFYVRDIFKIFYILMEIAAMDGHGQKKIHLIFSNLSKTILNGFIKNIIYNKKILYGTTLTISTLSSITFNFMCMWWFICLPYFQRKLAETLFDTMFRHIYFKPCYKFKQNNMNSRWRRTGRFQICNQILNEPKIERAYYFYHLYNIYSIPGIRYTFYSILN